MYRVAVKSFSCLVLENNIDSRQRDATASVLMPALMMHAEYNKFQRDKAAPEGMMPIVFSIY